MDQDKAETRPRPEKRLTRADSGRFPAGIVAARHLSAALSAGGAVAGIIRLPAGLRPGDQQHD